MAKASRFNRPYGPSAPGQAPWERLQSQPFGSDSLASRAATPSGRGYYDPERILERVARGRPGTSMQQAQAAMALEGFKELKGLLGQESLPGTPMTMAPQPTQPTQTPAGQSQSPGPWNSGFVFRQKPEKKKSLVEDYMSKFTINPPAQFKLFGTGT